MKIFGTPTNPQVRKVLVCAAEKGIVADLEVVSRRRPSVEFLTASPFEQMPAMANGDFLLSGSRSILRYLEAKFPEPSLVPTEPELCARAEWFDDFADMALGPKVEALADIHFFGPEVAAASTDISVGQALKEALVPAMEKIEAVAPKSGWLLGDFGIADVAVASCLKTLHYGWEGCGPKTRDWYERVADRPAWQRIAVMEDLLVKTAQEGAGFRWAERLVRS